MHASGFVNAVGLAATGKVSHQSYLPHCSETGHLRVGERVLVVIAACVIILLLTMTLELSHVSPEVVFLRVLRQPLGVHVEVPRLS